jgi:hypothetical protein
MTVENGGNAVTAPHNPEPTAPRTREESERLLLDFLERAAKGDPSTQAGLRAMLRGPIGAPLVEAYGNLASAAERAVIASAVGDNHVAREAIQAKLEALRAELAGPDAAPLERLLAERVVLCWLQLHHADVCAAEVGDQVVPRGDFHQRRQSRAQARYLAAIKALVTVRKLLRPPLSPLDLVGRPVPETGSMPRGRAAAAEVGVEN